MKKDNSVYLEDILSAIDKIDKYTKGLSYKKFEKTELFYDAIIRNLEIIGEAASKLSDEFLTEHPNPPIREAIRMRNALIHGYDQIKPEVVWQTIKEDLPQLREQISELHK